MRDRRRDHLVRAAVRRPVHEGHQLIPPAAPRPDPDTGDNGRPATTLVVVGLVAFITTLDNTIVAAAAPSVGRALRLDIEAVQWVSVSYLIAFAGLLLGAGALIDRWGLRRTLLGGLLLFGAAALVGGFATTFPMLLAARIGQGMAAAFVVPAALSLVRINLGKRHRALGVAVWTTALAVALAAGPVVGGALSQYLGWNWIFYLNVPFALAAAVLALGATPSGPGGRSSGSVGLLGLCLVTGASVLLILALTEGRPILAGVGLAAGTGFVLRQRATANPIVPGRLVRQRMFASGLVAQLLWGLGISGVVFFTPLLHQEFLGLDPTEAGLPLVVVAIAIVLATPLVTFCVRAVGPRWTAGVSLFLVAAGLGLIAVVDQIPLLVPRIPGLVIVGLGSAGTTPLTSASLDTVPAEDAGVASGLLTASRELSGAFGVALVGAVLTWRENVAAHSGAAAGPALAAGYTAGLLLAACFQALAAVVVLCWFRAPSPSWNRSDTDHR